MGNKPTSSFKLWDENAIGGRSWSITCISQEQKFVIYKYKIVAFVVKNEDYLLIFKYVTFWLHSFCDNWEG